jgi:hypothetical protein
MISTLRGISSSSSIRTRSDARIRDDRLTNTRATSQTITRTNKKKNSQSKE